MHSAKARLISDMDSRLKTKAEQHLHDFVKQAWPLVEPGTEYLDNWHIVLICEYLMAYSIFFFIFSIKILILIHFKLIISFLFSL